MKKQSTVFTLSSLPSCLLCLFVAENQSIKNNKLCKTNPIFRKPKMNLSHYTTKDYVNNLRLLKMAKQTQTKPICGELVEPIKLPSGREFRPKEIEHFSDFSIFPQHLKQVLHIFWQRGLEFYYSFSRWVLEFERPGVKGNPVYNRLLHRRFAISQLPGVNKFAAVHIIGHNRMLYVRKVYPYLMCSAGLRGHLQ
jgi:hypothetical protein